MKKQKQENMEWIDVEIGFVSHLGNDYRESILIKLEDIYRNFVTEELKLMSVISDIRKEQRFVHTRGIIGEATATANEEYIKVTVNRTPEKVEVWKSAGTQYARYVRDYWLGNIMYALEQLRNDKKIVHKYSDCTVVIKIYKAGRKDWDIDNQHVKYIIDAIRYSGIIPNDYWYNVQYCVLGESNKDTNMTEIYIMDRQNFIKIFQQLNTYESNTILETSI